MAKTLSKDRPKSTIADLIDDDLIQQATQSPPPEARADSLEPAKRATVLDVPVKEPENTVPEKAIAPAADSETTSAPPKTSPVSLSAPIPGERTGEHSDIQKMYRLTPTALRTLRELSWCLSRNLGFEINNSAVIRSILRVVHEAGADIHRLADEQLGPRQQPSTAIGNEHARDAIEAEIAGVILSGITKHDQNREF